MKLKTRYSATPLSMSEALEHASFDHEDGELESLRSSIKFLTIAVGKLLEKADPATVKELFRWTAVEVEE